MTRKYDYSLKYEEIDPNIKFRRCRFCKNFIKIKDLETKSSCKICYTIIHNRKRCKKCLLRKKTECFGKSKLYKDGFKSQCIDCNPRKQNPKKQKKAFQKCICRKKTETPLKETKKTRYARYYRKKTKERQGFIDKILEEFKDYKG